MDPFGEVIGSAVLPLQEYALRTKRTMEDTLVRAGRGVIRRGIYLTPPFTDGESPAETKARAHAAIERDLNRIFIPVKLKGKRRERVPGSAMVAVHQLGLKYKRPGAPMRRRFATPYGNTPLYVDRSKLSTLANKLRSHVGKFASGWLAAAQALQVRGVPSWIARHGTSRGRVRVELTGNEMSIEAFNHAPNVPYFLRTETQRRLKYAAEYQANAMRREMQALLLRDARAAGLKTA